MSRDERHERWNRMFTHLERRDVHAWRTSFVRALAADRAHTFASARGGRPVSANALHER
jgi:trehalose-6-phosphate synthase